MKRPTGYQASRWWRGIGQALVAVLVLAGIGPVASPRLVAAPEASPETVPLRTTAARLEPAGCQAWLGNGDFECGMRCFNGVPVWSSTSPSVRSAVSGSQAISHRRSHFGELLVASGAGGQAVGVVQSGQLHIYSRPQSVGADAVE